MTAPRIVVVGDVLLDSDIEGATSRLSPDAPVPVVEVIRETTRPGGAGLAAVLATRDGADVHLIAPVGHDASGRRLRDLLGEAGVSLLPLPMAGGTPVKQRVRVGEHAMMRLDAGAGTSGDEALAEHTLLAFDRLLQRADAILVSDYGRGTTSHPQVRELLARHAAALPLVWDPHPRGSKPVSGTLVTTPNVDEARLAVADEDRRDDWVGILELASQVTRTWAVRAACVTAGSRGAVLSYPGRIPIAVPAASAARRDACGAGDRFSASVVVSLARGKLLMDAVVAAVLEAGRFVSGGGLATVGRTVGTGGVPIQEPRSAGHGTLPASAEEVIARVRRGGGTVVATGGCFDLLHSGHVATLSAARSIGDCLVVLLNSDASVRALKGAGRPLVPQEDRARVLRELSCVDAVVIFDERRPDAALRMIQPDVWVKGGDYGAGDLPERRTLAEWGGRIVTVPYVPGRSTSALVQAARTEVAS